MEDAARAKKKLDDALKSNSLNEVEDELDRATTAQKQLKSAFESTQNAPYYKGQIADVQRLEDELAEATRQVEELTKRRDLIIDLKINVPFPDFDKMGSGFGDELAKELAALGYDYTPGKEVTPIKKKGGGRSGGSAPAGADGESIVKSLEREIQLLQVKDTLDNQLLQNQFTYQDNIERTEEILDSTLRSQAQALSAELLRTQNMEAYANYANEGFKETMAIVQAERDALLPLEQQRELLEAKLNGTEKEVRLRQEVDRIMQAAPTLERAKVEELVRGNDALSEQVKKAAELEELMGSVAQRVGTAIEDSIVTAIDAAVSGADDLNQKLQEIASSLLKDIGRMLIRAGINGLGAQMNIPGFAEGGTIQPNSLAIVGEKGPELLLNNSTPTRVFSNEDSRMMMSRQRDSMENYSPAMSSAPTPMQPISVKYDVTEINSMRFVSEEQLLAASSQAAKQGAKQGERSVYSQPA